MNEVVPDWQPHLLREAALREIEAALAREPKLVQLHFERARLLTAMGRLQEAKQIYLEILKQDPNQFAPFNNLGLVLNELGYRREALKVYREVVLRFPENPTGLLNLANTLYKLGELKEARLHYENVLRLVPGQVEAHRALSYLLTELQEEEAASQHRQKAGDDTANAAARYRGKKEPVRLLMLISPGKANSPIQRYLEDTVFMISTVVPDHHHPTSGLPPHQVIVNAIGDADLCADSLAAAERLLQQTTAPIINSPTKIRLTGRADNARFLGELEGVVTPKIVTLSREALTGSDAVAEILRQGFIFPLLLRTLGFHGGDHFLRVDEPDGLATAVAQLPGAELTVIQYLDARDADGKIRKYRVMMIDGQIHPLHKAISRGWMIHYFSAEMADSTEHRAEDAAFLEDMAGVLGARAMGALARIRDALGLDYAGADFSLGPNGDVLLFEANATMAIPGPVAGQKWDYRREPVRRIHEAVREMVVGRAGVARR